jgi:hyperpolarization activated cyclic nucleotide-gated potassium channel 1
MMIGVFFYSFTIGTLTSVLGRIDTRATQLRDKLEVIEVFCNESNINNDLKKKIKEALDYNSYRNAFSWIEKYAIFNELPPSLKCDVAMQIHDGAIGKLPFF